jgi:hypothetical protein
MDNRYLRGGMIILALLIIGLTPPSGLGAQKNRYMVLIDPAHGGDEAGVIVDKLREKDLNLNLALMIRKESQNAANIEFHGQGHDSVGKKQSSRRIESGLPSGPAYQWWFWEKSDRL